MVDDADSAVGLANELQGLVHMLHLIVVRMRRAVGRNESVDAECAVVGLVAEVATVQK